MKKIILSFVIIQAFLFVKAQNVSSVIEKVTVYQQNAKISRTATTTTSSGVSEIILDNLSYYILQNTIQVDIKGNATLLSATFRRNYLDDKQKDKRIKNLQDSSALLDYEVKWIDGQLMVLAEEQKLILSNNKLGSEKESMKAEELKILASYYSQRLLEINKQALELDKKKKKVQEIKYMINLQLNELNAKQSKPTGEIVLTVSSTNASKINIDFSYVVSQAGWTALYDIRSSGVDKPLPLIYKAQVYQNTGYDWKDVKMTVSTGNPSKDNDRPVMNPLFVDFYTPPAPAPQYQNYKRKAYQDQSTGGSQMMELNVASETSVEDYMIEEKEEGSPDYSPDYDVAITENQINAEYEIEARQDIPSDNKEHLVAIQEYKLDALFKYHTVPKLSSGAFLLAKINSYGQYNLLPGYANIFFEGMYIGQSYINTETTTDTLLISLGRDDKISVKRNQLNELTSVKTIGSSKKETKAYEIIVRNNKSAAITIEILDQIPISKQKDIEITVEEMSGARYQQEYGKLLWDLEIPAGQSKKIKLVYSIKYPKDKQIQETR